MDTTARVTPQLMSKAGIPLSDTEAGVQRTTSKLMDVSMIRCLFVCWMNRDTMADTRRETLERYELESVHLAKFRLVRSYSESRGHFVRGLPECVERTRVDAEAESHVRYHVLVAFERVFLDHGPFACTVPFQEVEMLVTSPRGARSALVYYEEETDDLRRAVPVCYERVVRVIPLSMGRLQQLSQWPLVARLATQSRTQMAHSELARNLAQKRELLPTFVSNSPLQNLERARVVSKQWMYWLYGRGAELVRCTNYALLCAVFDPDVVTRMADHRALLALMFFTVVCPEALRLPETLRFACGGQLGRGVLEPLVSHLQGGDVLGGRRSLGLDTVCALSRELLCQEAFAEPRARVRRMWAQMLDLSKDRVVEWIARRLGLDGSRGLWGHVELQRADGSTVDERVVGAAAATYDRLRHVYSRVHTRSVLVRSATAQETLEMRALTTPIVIESSEEPPPGMTHMCSNAAQLERGRLVWMLQYLYKTSLVQTVHYQLQLCRVQTCVRERGKPYIVVCANAALAHQARAQWLGDSVYSLGELLEQTRRWADREALMYPRGRGAEHVVVVVLDAVMFGIEQWLALLDRCRPLDTREEREARGPGGARVERVELVVVTDPFYMRPVVVSRHGASRSVYGTENVVLQLQYCEELLHRCVHITDPDVAEHADRMTFRAARLYYELTNGRSRQVSSATVYARMNQFVRMLVERLWLDDRDAHGRRMDSLLLKKIYVHLDGHDLTNRRELAESAFKENDYVHLADTGEMLALWNRNVPKQAPNKRNPDALRRELYTARTSAWLCDCAQPALYNKCNAIRFDQDSPWCLHRAPIDAPDTGSFDARVPSSIRDTAVGAVVTRAWIGCRLQGTPCVLGEGDRGFERVCFSRLPNDTHDMERVHGFYTHVVMQCTRDRPVSISSYTGPSPDVVYVNVPERTTSARFLRACALARTHVQMVHSMFVSTDDERGTGGEARGGHGRRTMERAKTDYMNMLRAGAAEGGATYAAAVDTVVADIMGHITPYANIYPSDGLWMKEIAQRLVGE